MSNAQQSDFFAGDAQPDLFGPAEPQALFRPEPDQVRARLHAILAEARTADVLPWKASRLALYRTVFPQMTNWLPDDEGRQLCFEFETELARLLAA